MSENTDDNTYCNEIESKTLQCLGPGCVELGQHSVLFVDTSTAWEYLFSITDEKYHPELPEPNNEETNVNVYNSLPDYARYDGTSLPRRDNACFFCRKGTDNAKNIPCRICEKIFHEECLRKRGYCDDEVGRTAISEPSVGWSCPHCEDVFGLLTDDEQEEVSDLFDNIAGDDGVIDMDEFITQRREEYRKLVGEEMSETREQQERELFQAIDIDSSGSIDKWEFQPYMALRYIGGRRKSIDIIRLLTPREVDNFRYYFICMDSKGVGFINQFDALRAYIQWYKSKVEPSQEERVDHQWYGGPDFDLKGSHVISELNITWEQYLEVCALHVMSGRVNTVPNRPKIPPMPVYLYSQSAWRSFIED